MKVNLLKGTIVSEDTFVYSQPTTMLVNPIFLKDATANDVLGANGVNVTYDLDVTGGSSYSTLRFNSFDTDGLAVKPAASDVITATVVSIGNERIKPDAQVTQGIIKSRIINILPYGSGSMIRLLKAKLDSSSTIEIYYVSESPDEIYNQQEQINEENLGGNDDYVNEQVYEILDYTTTNTGGDDDIFIFRVRVMRDLNVPVMFLSLVKNLLNSTAYPFVPTLDSAESFNQPFSENDILHVSVNIPFAAIVSGGYYNFSIYLYDQNSNYSQIYNVEGTTDDYASSYSVSDSGSGGEMAIQSIGDAVIGYENVGLSDQALYPLGATVSSRKTLINAYNFGGSKDSITVIEVTGTNLPLVIAGWNVYIKYAPAGIYKEVTVLGVTGLDTQAFIYVEDISLQNMNLDDIGSAVAGETISITVNDVVNSVSATSSLLSVLGVLNIDVSLVSIDSNNDTSLVLSGNMLIDGVGSPSLVVEPYTARLILREVIGGAIVAYSSDNLSGLFASNVDTGSIPFYQFAEEDLVTPVVLPAGTYSVAIIEESTRTVSANIGTILV